MSTSPPTQLIVTLIPDRNGACLVEVALRAADGTQSPPQRLATRLDGKLGAFIAAMQAIAGQQIDRA